MKVPWLRFGSLRVDPPLIMAPLAGITHAPFRRLVAELGGCGLFYTEMLSARALPRENPRTSPWLIRCEVEPPPVYQLLVYDPGEVEPAVRRAESLGAAAIDLNLGCSAPGVVKRGGGLGLLMDSKRLSRVSRALRGSTRLPLSAKLRFISGFDTGWLRDTCRFFEDAGFDLITIHPRLGPEKFKRPAKWEFVAEAQAAVKDIPVVGNGDVTRAGDALRMMEETGCRGVMIGRGAVARPWLFRLAAERLGRKITGQLPEPPQVFFRFAALLEEMVPGERRLGRLKQFTHYFARNYLFGHHLAARVQSAGGWDEAVEVAAMFFEEAGEKGLVEEDPRQRLP